MQDTVALLPFADITLENDDEVAAELEGMVRRRLHGRLSSFYVDVTEEGLILRGSAPSYYIKQLVQHAVMSESFLPIHANEIEVTESLRRRIH
jgi:hypothetical protein